MPGFFRGCQDLNMNLCAYVASTFYPLSCYSPASLSFLKPTWKGAHRLQMSTFLNSLPLKEILQQDWQPD